MRQTETETERERQADREKEMHILSLNKFLLRDAPAIEHRNKLQTEEELQKKKKKKKKKKIYKYAPI